MKYYRIQDLTGYNFKDNFYFWYSYKMQDGTLLYIDFNSIFKEEVDPNIFRKFMNESL